MDQDSHDLAERPTRYILKKDKQTGEFYIHDDNQPNKKPRIVRKYNDSTKSQADNAQAKLSTRQSKAQWLCGPEEYIDLDRGKWVCSESELNSSTSLGGTPSNKTSNHNNFPIRGILDTLPVEQLYHVG